MKKIYLDYNIISYLRTKRDDLLNKKYEDIASESMFVFSPAHLEDIAASAIRDKTDAQIISEEIEFLSKIAQRNALRPVTRNQVVIYDESPHDCYKRVIDQYAENDWAEEIEAAVILDANTNPIGSPREMNNIEPQKILNKPHYKLLIAEWLLFSSKISAEDFEKSMDWKFSDIKNRFCVFESYVNLAANLLEKLVTTEKRKKIQDQDCMMYRTLFMELTVIFSYQQTKR